MSRALFLSAVPCMPGPWKAQPICVKLREVTPKEHICHWQTSVLMKGQPLSSALVLFLALGYSWRLGSYSDSSHCHTKDNTPMWVLFTRAPQPSNSDIWGLMSLCSGTILCSFSGCYPRDTINNLLSTRRLPQL